MADIDKLAASHAPSSGSASGMGFLASFSDYMFQGSEKSMPNMQPKASDTDEIFLQRFASYVRLRQADILSILSTLLAQHKAFGDEITEIVSAGGMGKDAVNEAVMRLDVALREPSNPFMFPSAIEAAVPIPVDSRVNRISPHRGDIDTVLASPHVHFASPSVHLLDDSNNSSGSPLAALQESVLASVSEVSDLRREIRQLAHNMDASSNRAAERVQSAPEALRPLIEGLHPLIERLTSALAATEAAAPHLLHVLSSLRTTADDYKSALEELKDCRSAEQVHASGFENKLREIVREISTHASSTTQGKNGVEDRPKQQDDIDNIVNLGDISVEPNNGDENKRNGHFKKVTKSMLEYVDPGQEQPAFAWHGHTHDNAQGVDFDNTCSMLDFVTRNDHQTIVDGLLRTIDKQRMPPRQRWYVLKCSTREPRRQSPLAIMLKSQTFERVLALIILANVVFLGYTAELAVNHYDEQTEQFNLAVNMIELMFLLFFAVEMCLKIYVHSIFYFIGDEMFWNMLDCLLVGVSAFNWVLNAVDPKRAGSNSVTFIRLFRLLRVSKVAQVFRILRVMQSFRELRVLLTCIASLLIPLCWCFALLFMFFYIFAIVFVYAASGYLAENVTELKRQNMVDRWGSIRAAMESLFMSCTGGQDWINVAEPLRDAGELYFWLFLFFVAFVLLAVLNILTGIFTEKAHKIYAADKAGVLLERLDSEREMVEELCRTFCMMSGKDFHEHAILPKEQFLRSLDDPAMRARFTVMDLHIWDGLQFYKMLSSLSEGGDVTFHSFVSGCMQLKGPAKNISSYALSVSITGLYQRLRSIEQILEANLLGATQPSKIGGTNERLRN